MELDYFVFDKIKHIRFVVFFFNFIFASKEMRKKAKVYSRFRRLKMYLVLLGKRNRRKKYANEK